jgi:hypothetical protein
VRRHSGSPYPGPRPRSIFCPFSIQRFGEAGDVHVDWLAARVRSLRSAAEALSNPTAAALAKNRSQTFHEMFQKVASFIRPKRNAAGIDLWWRLKPRLPYIPVPSGTSSQPGPPFRASKLPPSLPMIPDRGVLHRGPSGPGCDFGFPPWARPGVTRPKRNAVIVVMSTTQRPRQLTHAGLGSRRASAAIRLRAFNDRRGSRSFIALAGSCPHRMRLIPVPDRIGLVPPAGLN